jgi:hypothetical protein
VSITDEHLSAAIHGSRQAEDGAPVALTRSGPSPLPGRTPPAEGDGRASALYTLAMCGLFTAALVMLVLLNVPGERLTVTPLTAPGEPEVEAPAGPLWWGRP